MRTKKPVPRRSPAQSLVEFALIVPLLVAVIFGIIELGILFSVYIGMTNSAREAARAGSVYQYTGAAPLSGDSTAQATIDADRALYINQVITDTISPLIDPTTELATTVTYTTVPLLPENVYRAGDTITVQLVHDHHLFFGLFGRQTIQVRATSSMRIEPGGEQ